MQETTKLTKKSSTEKNKWKRARCDHVKKGNKKNQRSRFLQAYGNRNKKYTTHLKMAM
jgi:hypothetical protein